MADRALFPPKKETGRIPQSAYRIPDKLRDAPERVRQDMRVQALSSTWYLATIVLGYTKLLPDTHGPLCTFLDTCTGKRRLIQMPRSHFKTTITTVTHKIRLLLNNPELRMLLVGDTAPNARKHLKKIANHFEHNRLLRWLFPEKIWEDTSAAPAWSQDQIFLPTASGYPALHGEPTIDAIGAGGAAVSRHYDIINADDLIGEDEFFSEVEMEKKIDWASGLEALFVPPVEDGLMDIPSTFWRVDDVYAFFESFFGGDAEPVRTGPYSYKKNELDVFRRGAIEGGQPIFPGAVTLQYLMRLQEKNPERYAAQYANNPYAAGVSYFRPEYRKWYEIAAFDNRELMEGTPIAVREHIPVMGRIDHGNGIPEILSLQDGTVYTLCDPHAGGSKRKRFKGGRAAVITVLVQPAKERIVILEVWLKRATTDLIVDQLFLQNARWNPELVSVEANGLQKMLKHWIDERVERAGYPPLPYQPYIPKSEKDSELRIKGLQPLWRAGQIYGRKEFVELWEEYQAWPRGSQDGMDCLAQVLHYADIGWDASRLEELDEVEQAVLHMRTGRSMATGY